MNTTKQALLKKNARELGVVFAFDVGQSRENPMRLTGEAHMRGLERFAHPMFPNEQTVLWRTDNIEKIGEDTARMEAEGSADMVLAVILSQQILQGSLLSVTDLTTSAPIATKPRILMAFSTMRLERFAARSFLVKSALGDAVSNVLKLSRREKVVRIDTTAHITAMAQIHPFRNLSPRVFVNHPMRKLRPVGDNDLSVSLVIEGAHPNPAARERDTFHPLINTLLQRPRRFQSTIPETRPWAGIAARREGEEDRRGSGEESCGLALENRWAKFGARDTKDRFPLNSLLRGDRTLPSLDVRNHAS